MTRPSTPIVNDPTHHPALRRALLLGMGCGFVAFVIATVIEWQDPARSLFDSVTYPLCAVAVSVMWLGILRLPEHLRTISKLLIVGLVGFFSAKLSYLLFFARPDLELANEMTETMFWFPCIYILAFLIPGLGFARRLAFGFSFSTTLIGLLYVTLTLGEPWHGVRHAVLQLALANLGLAVMTQGFNAHKDHMAQSQKREAALHILTRTDPLTGLPNRLACEEVLVDAVKQGDGFAVVFVDLDRFKAVNDTYGHDVGDALLQGVAGRLSHHVRDDDVLARISGDEFVLLIRRIQEEHAAFTLVTKLKAVLDTPFVFGEVSVQTSASMGFCLYPQHGASAEALLKRADQAMYRVKGTGRNGVGSYRPAPLPSAAEAAQAGELSLHYQPIYTLDGHFPVSVEAFLRWEHPERGPLQGNDALALLEHDAAAEAYILGAACRQHAQWRHQGYVTGAVAVNISAPMFARADFFNTVERTLITSGTAPCDLVLELQETAFANEAHSQALLRRLHTLGVRIALDDFGSGASSLHVLNHLTLDFVKLDRSVINTLSALRYTPHPAFATIEATLAAAQVLGLTVVAEGVETKEQLERLRALGVHTAQGYYFSAPVAADVLARAFPKRVAAHQSAAISTN